MGDLSTGDRLRVTKTAMTALWPWLPSATVEPALLAICAP